jgi:metal-sulfur cluster biosynthetic enzyme
LLEIEKKALELLKGVKEPVSDVNIVDAGIVSKVEYDPDEKLLTVYLDLARRGSSHPFEMAIEWAVYAHIVREVVKVLEDEFPEIEVVDSMTLQRYYPIEE